MITTQTHYITICELLVGNNTLHIWDLYSRSDIERFSTNHLAKVFFLCFHEYLQGQWNHLGIAHTHPPP